jgi:hypothetical protein
VCDLGDITAVRELQQGLARTAGQIDGVIHLVGGWRGAQGITDQTDEDWDFLERSAVTTLRNVTRVFYDDLAASPCGRFAMVSSTAVGSPAAGVASYVAAKAAAEAWTMASGRGLPPGRPASGTRTAQPARRRAQRRRRLCGEGAGGRRHAQQATGTEVPRLHGRGAAGRGRRRALQPARR